MKTVQEVKAIHQNNIQKHYEKEYRRFGSMIENFGNDQVKLDNKEWSIKYRDEVRRMLDDKKLISYDKSEDLENLHSKLDQELINYDIDHGISEVGRLFYETDDKFINLYHEWLKHLYEDIFKFDFYFQETPTFRFHFPDADEYGATHYPRYHSDVQYGHSPREINLWWSLTKNKRSGLRIMGIDKSLRWYSAYGFNFDKFIEMSWSANSIFNDYGFLESDELKITNDELFVFDSRCIHTGESRQHDDDYTTRISLDVRIIPVEDYEWKVLDGRPLYRGKGRMGAEFRPGGKFGYHKSSLRDLMGIQQGYGY